MVWMAIVFTRFHTILFFPVRVWLSCWNKANCPHVGPGSKGSTLVRGLSKEASPVFTLVSEKTTENSERLGRHVQPGIEIINALPGNALLSSKN